MKAPDRESGQGLVEYGLILILVAIVVIVALQLFGTSVVVVYARVMAGLNGQAYSGVGQEVLVTGFDVTVSGGPAVCTVTVSNTNLVGLQDGQPLANTSVSVSASASGTSSQTISGTTNGGGLATSTNTVNLSGANCSGTVTVGGASKSYSR